MNTKRDFNKEFDDGVGRKYAYNFDFDVMHHYMIKAFQPSIVSGNALELGSFKGDFTKRLLCLFDTLTCVEASNLAIEEAKTRLPKNVRFIEGMFETLKLVEKFDNIFLTHVLEHVDDAVGVLRRINDEWLSDSGRLFLVCPNANAPSRQIAVRMGLISHNYAITPGEAPMDTIAPIRSTHSSAMRLLRVCEWSNARGFFSRRWRISNGTRFSTRM